MMGGSYRPTRTSIRTLAVPIVSRHVGAANPSVFELRKDPEQIATQPAAVAARDPAGACPIERLGDGIRGRNHL